jgi:microcystin-dependent protein
MSTYYNYNKHNISTPPGTIISYVGNTSPDGWLICDGSTVTVSDSRFENLYTILNTAMGVTTNTANSVTTPNLQSKVIYGRAAATSGVSTTGGADTVTLTTNHLPAHTHTGTTDGMNANNPHNHQIPMGDKDDLNCTHGTGQYPLGDGPNTYATGCYVYGTDINHGHTFTTASTGAGNAFNNLPPYFTTNYLIKY